MAKPPPFELLYRPEGLRRLALEFEQFLKARAPELSERLAAYRKEGEGWSPVARSEFLVAAAPFVSRFLAEKFEIESELQALSGRIREQFATLFRFRREIVFGEAERRFKGKDPGEFGDLEVLKRRFGKFSEEALAALALRLKEEGGEAYEALLRWIWAARQLEGFAPEVASWQSFRQPRKRDFQNLVPHREVPGPGYKRWEGVCFRRRDGFELTDRSYRDLKAVLYEVDHCIYCHQRDADSCSKGMRSRKSGQFKRGPFGDPVVGCPLEEKISEMHWLYRQGDPLAALCLITIDNPLCAGTGHRICNDCMKACIYQKSEPVDIPKIETAVLTDVLEELPFGFELYALLTRWNPLRIEQPYPRPFNGKKVLICGMGPAGYTLAHYLLNEGFGVVGIDGLKIEPLPEELLREPIREWKQVRENLSERTIWGFGGVAEYGITVRWDKNFLKAIYLILARWPYFRLYDGVRFGGSFTVEEVWEMGFDHLAIAVGAGKPTVIPLKNNLPRGMRQASDFLMTLQLTGAAKRSSLANLQIRLPAGVIGGGLTAIDTATELLAYYPVQVEKILERYERLCERLGEEAVRSRFDEEELEILEEFLEHGRAVREERRRAEERGETPNFLPLLRRWGGVTIFYRRRIQDSPAYRQNHEEIAKALEEGIWIAEQMAPREARTDRYGHLSSVLFERTDTKETIEVPLRTLIVAAGTSPNTIYEEEHPGTFERLGKFYRPFELSDGELRPYQDELFWPKLSRPAPFTSYRKGGRYVTFLGDNHPVFAGNVVQAMASAKQTYPYIRRLFGELGEAPEGEWRAFVERLERRFRAELLEVKLLAPRIVELIVRAPQAAAHFEPGQFYRIQNYERSAPEIEGTRLVAEPIALTGAWVDKEEGLISLIVLEVGASTKLCRHWRPGQRLVVMGVTGTPTEIPSHKTVLLAGGGLGNAVLFSIGKALRRCANRVLYFAGYRTREGLFHREEIEEAADVVVWSVDRPPRIEPRRPQDRSFVGNIVEAMVAYARGELGEVAIPLEEVDHLITIGSDRMMAAVERAREGPLAPFLPKLKTAIGSINAPMQCMMKGVCAQCLCRRRDPEGETYFYACAHQDQPLERVDFDHLSQRLRQNSVQEKLADLWLEAILDKI